MNGVLFVWDGFLFLSLSLPSVLLLRFVMILTELLTILTYLQPRFDLDRSRALSLFLRRRPFISFSAFPAAVKLTLFFPSLFLPLFLSFLS